MTTVSQREAIQQRQLLKDRQKFANPVAVSWRQQDRHWAKYARQSLPGSGRVDPLAVLMLSLATLPHITAAVSNFTQQRPTTAGSGAYPGLPSAPFPHLLRNSTEIAKGKGFSPGYNASASKAPPLPPPIQHPAIQRNRTSIIYGSNLDLFIDQKSAPSTSLFIEEGPFKFSLNPVDRQKFMDIPDRVGDPSLFPQASMNPNRKSDIKDLSLIGLSSREPRETNNPEIEALENKGAFFLVSDEIGFDAKLHIPNSDKLESFILSGANLGKGCHLFVKKFPKGLQFYKASMQDGSLNLEHIRTMSLTFRIGTVMTNNPFSTTVFENGHFRDIPFILSSRELIMREAKKPRAYIPLSILAFGGMAFAGKKTLNQIQKCKAIQRDHKYQIAQFETYLNSLLLDLTDQTWQVQGNTLYLRLLGTQKTVQANHLSKRAPGIEFNLKDDFLLAQLEAYLKETYKEDIRVIFDRGNRCLRVQLQNFKLKLLETSGSRGLFVSALIRATPEYQKFQADEERRKSMSAAQSQPVAVAPMSEPLALELTQIRKQEIQRRTQIQLNSICSKFSPPLRWQEERGHFQLDLSGVSSIAIERFNFPSLHEGYGRMSVATISSDILKETLFQFFRQQQMTVEINETGQRLTVSGELALTDSLLNTFLTSLIMRSPEWLQLKADQARAVLERKKADQELRQQQRYRGRVVHSVVPPVAPLEARAVAVAQVPSSPEPSKVPLVGPTPKRPRPTPPPQKDVPSFSPSELLSVHQKSPPHTPPLLSIQPEMITAQPVAHAMPRIIESTKILVEIRELLGQELRLDPDIFFLNLHFHLLRFFEALQGCLAIETGITRLIDPVTIHHMRHALVHSYLRMQRTPAYLTFIARTLIGSEMEAKLNRLQVLPPDIKPLNQTDFRLEPEFMQPEPDPKPYQLDIQTQLDFLKNQVCLTEKLNLSDPESLKSQPSLANACAMCLFKIGEALQTLTQRYRILLNKRDRSLQEICQRMMRNPMAHEIPDEEGMPIATILNLIDHRTLFDCLRAVSDIAGIKQPSRFNPNAAPFVPQKRD